MMIILNFEQTKTLSNFFSNMAVAWFVGAFISETSPFSILIFVVCGILALSLSLYLIRIKNYG